MALVTPYLHLFMFMFNYVCRIYSNSLTEETQTNFISQIRDNTIIGDRVDMMAGCQEGRSPSMLAAHNCI